MAQVNINWDRLRGPFKYFSIFSPDKVKVDKIYKVLKSGKLNLPDEHRNEAKLHEIMLYLFPYHLKPAKRPFHLFYEINDGRYCGGLGFLDIQYNYRSHMFMKIWEEGFYGIPVSRELTKLTEIVMEEFQLKRLGAETPDKDIVSMAKQAGFKVEGTQKYGFRWNNQLLTNYLMRKVQEE